MTRRADAQAVPRRYGHLWGGAAHFLARQKPQVRCTKNLKRVVRSDVIAIIADLIAPDAIDDGRISIRLTG